MKFVLTVLLLLPGLAGAQTAISDSLVENLKCRNLTIKSIRKAIREEAFSVQRHFPVRNWSFHYAGMKLANCWGLSSLQRRFFYLGAIEGPRSITRSEVQAAEVKHFFRLRNLPLIKGSIPERPAVENESTIDNIVTHLQDKRLPTLVLRFSKNNQHAVVAKSYSEDTNGNISINVYDSNQPGNDGQIIYLKRLRQFTAVNVARQISSTPTNGNRVGVFIVDEDELVAIEQTLLRHYQGRCP